MRSVDVNVLLHACFDDSAEHDHALACLDECRRAPGGLSMLSQVATSFVRLATDTRVYGDAALTPDQAVAFLTPLLLEPAGRVIQPGRGHWAVFTDLLIHHKCTRSDVTDAWLAAFAIDARVDWYSFDRGFARFRGLRWIDPRATSA